MLVSCRVDPPLVFSSLWGLSSMYAHAWARSNGGRFGWAEAVCGRFGCAGDFWSKFSGSSPSGLGIFGRVLRGLCGSLLSPAKYGYGSNCQIRLVLNPWKWIQDGIRFILFYSINGSLSVHPWHGRTSAVTSNSLNVVSGWTWGPHEELLFSWRFGLYLVGFSPSLPFPNVCSGWARKVCLARNDIVELTRIDRIRSAGLVITAKLVW
jgi:hypothetical protein